MQLAGALASPLGGSLAVQSLSLSLARKKLFAREVVTLKAIARYSDGSTADVTSSVTWVSSDPSVATVDNTGRVKGSLAGGTCTITAVI